MYIYTYTLIYVYPNENVFYMYISVLPMSMYLIGSGAEAARKLRGSAAEATTCIQA